ncbi:MerR family transcriptional regulator [Shewanella pneumatophori]|uniref:MerR family transcriptional regulator n=1 Tax=Shewanella pneumatophori TaxID=314092 RepID=A0A9X2CHR5_9GAMM|nr:MerR family transcriptional regulator [Shewanella pneumatophori]MCL1138785.1 MerR family transcriptional regulator [Shewanella pneumatophori]
MADEKTLTPEAWVSIGEAAQRTGVNPVTLRAWQRRFGLVTPKRTPKGHRLYGSSHLAQIEEILYWLNQGVAISKIKPLLGNESVDGVKNNSVADANATQSDQQQASVWQQHISKLNQLTLELNAKGLNDSLNQLSSLYPFSVLKSSLYWPWLRGLEALLVERFDGPVIEAWLLDELSAFFARKRLTDKVSSIQNTSKSVNKSANNSVVPKPILLVALARTDKWSPLMISAELSAHGVSHRLIRVFEINQLHFLVQRLKVEQVFIVPHVQSGIADIREFQALLQQFVNQDSAAGEVAEIASEAVNIAFAGIYAKAVNQTLGREHYSVSELLLNTSKQASTAGFKGDDNG